MLKIAKMLRNRKGFTLVELMVVVVIIGVLSAIAVPMFQNSSKAAAQGAHDANLRILDGAIQQYRANEGKWPTKMSDLDTYVKNASTMTIPSGLTGLSGTYGLSKISGATDQDPPLAAPGGSWDKAYNKDVKIASSS